MIHLSHHEELDAIRRLWRKSNRVEHLDQAKQRLRALRREFPYVLAVGHELVLVMEKLGEVDGAAHLLEELERQFRQLDEETLCRWGKIFKKRGERALSPMSDATQAIHDFEQAGKYYGRAFEIQHGFYPRINELTLQFLRAALWKDLHDYETSKRLLDDVRRKAQLMLADANIWRARKDDDHIWLPATKGEAQVLAGDWKQASDRYGDAIAAARGQQFYFDCMREQIKMLLDACGRLGITPEGALADPDKFFSAGGGGDTPLFRTASRPRTNDTEVTIAYDPKPIDTLAVSLPISLTGLLEKLAENNHDVWAATRMEQGWTYGPTRDDANKRHPCLVPYGDLPESEKEYDRRTAQETLKAILTLGYGISSPAAED